jgi:hypothetical protein
MNNPIVGSRHRQVSAREDGRDIAQPNDDRSAANAITRAFKRRQP